LSPPGVSFWKYSVTDPSALGFKLLRGLTVNLYGVSPFAKVSVI